MQFPELEQKKQKKILVFEVIASDLRSTNSRILEHDTCHWQPICYQAILRFKISLREVYSKADSLRVMKSIIKVLS